MAKGFRPSEELARWRRSERGALRRDGRWRMALCYPNRYRIAASSLGFQVVYRTVNARAGWACERAVYPEDVAAWVRSGAPLRTIEQERNVGDADVVAFSIAFELDVPHVAHMLALAGIPALRTQRDASHPLVLAGGPLTTSNPLPLGPFVDAVVVGDGEPVLDRVLAALERGGTRSAQLERLSVIDGVWVPRIHGDRIPRILRAPADALPAVGQWTSPHAELREMFLVEPSRGCPRRCAFCVVRAPSSPMRSVPSPEEVLAAVPAWASRVGFVGAAISDYGPIRTLLRMAVERGLQVGVSSLRADRLDEDFVALLRRGGYRTLTVASDALSERMRSRIMKGIRERHLVRAAHLARWARLRLLKLYVVVGLPGETDDDVDEFVDLCHRLSGIVPLALALSPFVPKLHTPLHAAPFAGVRPVERLLRQLRRRLRGRADLRAASARWAWVEYRLSQGGPETGLAAWEALQAGGAFAAWRAALRSCAERGALEAARRHGLWAPSGEEPGAAPPPRPPPRLPWRGVEPVGPPPA